MKYKKLWTCCDSIHPWFSRSRALKVPIRAWLDISNWTAYEMYNNNNTYQAWCMYFWTAASAWYRTSESSWVISSITRCLAPMSWRNLLGSIRHTFWNIASSPLSHIQCLPLSCLGCVFGVLTHIIGTNRQNNWAGGRAQYTSECSRIQCKRKEYTHRCLFIPQQLIVVLLKSWVILFPECFRFMWGRPFELACFNFGCILFKGTIEKKDVSEIRHICNKYPYSRKTLEILLQSFLDIVNILQNIWIRPFATAKILHKGQKLDDEHCSKVFSRSLLDKVLIQSTEASVISPISFPL